MFANRFFGLADYLVFQDMRVLFWTEGLTFDAGEQGAGLSDIAGVFIAGAADDKAFELVPVKV